MRMSRKLRVEKMTRETRLTAPPVSGGAEMSEDLVQLYPNATVLRHTGGHHIPASGKEKPVYIQFLESVRPTAS